MVRRILEEGFGGMRVWEAKREREVELLRHCWTFGTS